MSGQLFAAANLRPPPGYSNLENINVNNIIPDIVSTLLFLAFIVALIFLLIGGIRWIMSGGDKAASESAKGTLTAAIIGLVIVLLVWAILNLFEMIFGINITTSSLVVPEFFR